MSLSENGNNMVMPVGPMYGNGNGFGMNDGNFFWYFILFFFFAMFGGCGNGYGYGGAQPQVNISNDLQRGFDQQNVMSGLSDLAIGMNNGFNSSAMALQNCCCENRAAVADLKYTVATEACADRAAISNALNEVQRSQSAGFQMIIDKMCQLELDSYKTKVSDLQTQLNITALRESQTAQTAQVLADNAAQTATLRQALNPTPIPAYVVQNPNGCGCGQNFGCGC